MNPYLGLGIFRELRDISKFKTVRVSFDSIEWENEVDLDPKVLYYERKDRGIKTDNIKIYNIF